MLELPTRLRQTLEVRDSVVEVVDVVVSTLVELADTDDHRSLQERLAWLQTPDPTDNGREETEAFERDLAEIAENLNKLSDEELPRWTKRLAGQSDWKRFARRLLGARTYDRLSRALQQDLSAMADGFRRLVQIAQPFAVAFDDVLGVLTNEQLRGIDSTHDWAAVSAFKFLFRLDGAVGNYIEDHFDWRQFGLDHVTVEDADITGMADHLRSLATGPTRQKLAQLNAKFARKISGAEDALSTSADGASQAAHSLVELIDRILRTAFTEEAVLAWIAASGRSAVELTYIADSGLQRPNKKAQALCFVHAGRPSEQKSAVHELLATGLASARSQLQGLKHADTGDHEEVRRVRSLMAAVEGFFTLALRVGWATLDEVEVDELRRRLTA